MTAGYFPLFRRFLESSIMEEELPVRFLWLAMLLKADRQGIVHGTPFALSRLANMSIPDTGAALEVLQAPDPDSTTEDDEGRRVKMLGPNKWLLINYEHYRQMAQKDRDKQLNAEAAKRYRDGLKGKDDRHGASSSVMEGHGSVMDSASGSGSVLVSGVATPKKKKKRSVFKKPLLADVVSYLDEKGETRIDPSSFLDFYESKGWMVGKNPMKDWKAAIRQWIRARDEGHVKPGGVDMHVGAAPKRGLVEATDKGRKVLVKHIMKHAVHLAMLEGLTEDQTVVVRSAAEELEALADSDIPKGLMEQKFYTIHDQMMKMLFDSLSETEDAELQVDFPGGGINFDAWVRKYLQEQFKINDPLEYEIGGE